LPIISPINQKNPSDSLSNTCSYISNIQLPSPLKDIDAKLKNLSLTIFCDKGHPFNYETPLFPSGRIKQDINKSKAMKESFRNSFIKIVNNIFKR